jgi:RNA polymerase sigma-70 factor (ECF subfamily)
VSSSTFAIDLPVQLIERLRRHDERAFEQLYRLFERPVHSLAQRMLGDPHEAQDVLQEVMISVLDKLDQFRGDAPFWGWLRQIAVNTVLMRLRKHKPLEYTDEIQDFGTGPETALAALQGVELERALAELAPTTRSVMWLYYVEGYTHDEIAGAFGKSLSFSKSQVLRGAERLRRRLGGPIEVGTYA